MLQRPFLKICGVANPEDAALVSASGADCCGVLVGVSFSERSVPIGRAKVIASASTIPVVVLLCNPAIQMVDEVVREIEPYAIQFLCQEPPEFIHTMRSRVSCEIWKTVHLPVAAGQPRPEAYAEAGAHALLVDSMDASEGFTRFGGTGKVADWKAAAEIVSAVSVPVLLAGGIDADNVARALADVNPYGIDLCSGVEASKGKKDPAKLQLLVSRFKAAAARMERNAR